MFALRVADQEIEVVTEESEVVKHNSMLIRVDQVTQNPTNHCGISLVGLRNENFWTQREVT